MSKPTPPTYKTLNWRSCNEALKHRGSLTLLTASAAPLFGPRCPIFSQSEMRTAVRKSAPQRLGIPAARARNHCHDGIQADDALTIKPDQSDQANQPADASLSDKTIRNAPRSGAPAVKKRGENITEKVALLHGPFPCSRYVGKVPCEETCIQAFLTSGTARTLASSTGKSDRFANTQALSLALLHKSREGFIS